MKTITTVLSRLLVILLVCIVNDSFAQATSWIIPRMNPLNYAAGFLLDPIDARSLGMGLTGVSGQSNVNSTFWNPAKMAFNDFRLGGSLSYRTTVKPNEIGLNTKQIQFATVYKLGGKSAVGLSYRRVLWEEIIITNNYGVPTSAFRPVEYAIDGSFSHKFNTNFSAGLTARYISSDLYPKTNVNGGSTQLGKSLAFDLGIHYKKPLKLSESLNSDLSLGLAITNLGSKISYYPGYKYFIPTLLRLGSSYKVYNEHHSFTLQVDINKLLVPTPPYYKLNDSTGLPEVDTEGHYIISQGKDPNVSVLKGLFQSFNDAPGGRQEELREIAYGIGFEYAYRDLGYLRIGGYHQNKYKGIDRYLTVGIGGKYKRLVLDIALLKPVNQNFSRSKIIDFSAFYTI